MDFSDIILKKNWEFCYQRNMTYQKARLFSYGYLHLINKVFKIDTQYQLYRFNNLECEQFFETEETRKAFDIVGTRFQSRKSTKLLISLKKTIIKDYRKFNSFIASLPVTYNRKSGLELFAAFTKYYSHENAMCFTSWLLFSPFEEELLKALRISLERKYSSNEIERIISIIIQPTISTPLENYHNSLCTIKKASIKNKKKLLKKSLAYYIHKGMYDVNYPQFTLVQLEKDLSAIKLSEAKLYSKQLMQKYKLQKKLFYTICNREKKDPYLHALISLVSIYANYKEWKPYYREQSNYKFKPIIEAIAKKLGFTLEQVAFMTFNEMNDVLVKQKKFSAKIFQQRINNSVLLSTRIGDHFITDPVVLKKIDQVLLHKATTIVNGMCGYPGKVMGLAKIIISNKDFEKFNDGDILITGTTRPDYLPIMKKASAIITNEGGLLSHAAIISREMKKPCVIGTKIATKIFKDGDSLEIDATLGIVKKI